MKLVIVFEVPDASADTYADVAAQLIQHHAFAEHQKIRHWSFDTEMRPVAARLISDPEAVRGDMVEAADTMAELLS